MGLMGAGAASAAMLLLVSFRAAVLASGLLSTGGVVVCVCRGGSEEMISERETLLREALARLGSVPTLPGVAQTR
jgi:hypothetical protein